MSLSKTARCAIAGAAAGAANGFFGAGGGMVLVPLFRRWAKLDERESLATPLLVILPLCIVSAAVYSVESELRFSEALPYLIGGTAGGYIGGRLFKRVPARLLRRILALFIIYGGIRSLL